MKLVAMTVIRVLLVPNLGTHNTPGLKSSSQQLTRCSGSFARMKIPNDERETGWSSDGLMKSIEIQNLVGFSMFFPGSRSLFGYLLSKLHDAWFIWKTFEDQFLDTVPRQIRRNPGLPFLVFQMATRMQSQMQVPGKLVLLCGQKKERYPSTPQEKLAFLGRF